MDCALSEFNRLETGSQTERVDDMVFEKATFQDRWNVHLKAYVNVWVRFHELILNTFEAKDILLIHYEDLKHNPLSILKLILQFLGMRLDNNVLPCLKKNIQGPYLRKVKNDHSLFLESVPAELQAHIQELSKQILDKMMIQKLQDKWI